MLIESADRVHDARVTSWTLYWDSEGGDGLVVRKVDPFTEEMRGFCSVHGITVRERPWGFSPWSERSAPVKLWGFADMASRVQVGDYVVHFDSDTMIFSSEIFDDIDCGADFVGFQNEPREGGWQASMGAMQAVCVNERNLRLLSDPEVFDRVIEEMYDAGICSWNGDDVVTSYLFTKGAKDIRGTPHAMNGGLEEVVTGAIKPPGLVHYGSNKGTFLGVPDCEKWMYPKMLKAWMMENRRSW